MRVFYLAALVAVGFALPSWAGPSPRGQESSSAPRKFDAFGDLSADDTQARLDAFALELQKTPPLRGYIVGYGEPRRPRGVFLRQVYGYLHYLVESRGVSPDSLRVVEGGDRDRRAFELWLAPEGSAPPAPSPSARATPRQPFKFDEVLTGVGCEPEFTLALYELNDGLRFYAAALRDNPRSRGRITVSPGAGGGDGGAARVARDAKNLLVKEHGIEAGRLITRIGRRRQACTRVELWVEPARPAEPPDDADQF